MNLFFGCLLGLFVLADLLSNIPAWIFVLLLIIYISIVAYGVINIRSQFFMPVHFKSNTSKKEIAISFDDGPVPVNTEQILNILKEYEVKAAFFCIGNRISENPALLQTIHRNGHIVGNHTYSHHFFFDLFSFSRMFRELKHTNEIIENQIGLKPVFFRPPYGVINPTLRRAIQAAGFETIGWSVRSLDTFITNEAKLFRKITSGLKPGAVYLFHDTSPAMIAVLGRFIKHVKAEGYNIVRLDKLLVLQPYA